MARLVTIAPRLRPSGPLDIGRESHLSAKEDPYFIVGAYMYSEAYCTDCT